MALDTSLGWSAGDDVRVLVASGLPVGVYQVQQIQHDMNVLGASIPGIVDPVLELLDQFDAAQAKFQSLNETSDSRVLVKVDVLEWEAVGGAGSGYSPEREIMRIRWLLYQYFGGSILFSQGMMDGVTQLIRS